MKPLSHPGSRRARRIAGFTLLEVLIALLVLSLGLLGLAGLQAYAMRNNQSANFRTQATNLAYQMTDMIRAYRGAANPAQDPRNHANVRRLIADWASFSAGPTGALSCTSSDSLICDRQRWAQALQTLPNGRARIGFIGPTGANPGLVTIEICWTDDRSQASTASTTGCTGASEGYGIATVGPAGGSTSWGNNAFWMRTRI